MTTGNLSFEAGRAADHDDLVIALALAVWVQHAQGEPRHLSADEKQAVTV